MDFYRYIGSQFSNLRGIIGKICFIIMNLMNKVMYNNITDALILSHTSKVLDICYGYGYLSNTFYYKEFL